MSQSIPLYIIELHQRAGASAATSLASLVLLHEGAWDLQVLDCVVNGLAATCECICLECGVHEIWKQRECLAIATAEFVSRVSTSIDVPSAKGGAHHE